MYAPRFSVEARDVVRLAQLMFGWTKEDGKHYCPDCSKARALAAALLLDGAA
jgi:hypothetical protein